jgi:hypothetical protein
MSVASLDRYFRPCSQTAQVLTERLLLSITTEERTENAGSFLR